MTDTTFDAASFIQSTIDKPMETDYQLCPEGTFQAMIGDFNEDAVTRIEFEYKRGPKAGIPGSMIKFNVPFSIQDPAVLASMGRDNVQVEMQLILDVNELGQLAWGKDRNVKLGQIRDAVNQNNPGSWSIMNLRGAGPCMVKVTHETFKRADGSDGKAARVQRVVKMA